MRAVAAIPAIGLIFGSVVGLVAPDLRFAAGAALMAACAAVGILAHRSARSLVVAGAVGGGFAVGGAMLSADAWHGAWRPSLRPAFEQLARDERAEAGRHGRRFPEDDEAFAVVSGRLRADAAPTATGVSLSVEIDSMTRRLGPGAASRPGPGRSPSGDPAAPDSELAVAGGIVVTVIGAFAAERIDAWRAGRRIRMPVQLRRPARYLNPDVPDFERALARRGTTLVGTVKSGALVELLEPAGWVDEAAGRVRAYARRAIARTVLPWSAQSAAIVAAIVIGDRAGLDEEVQRRLQEAGTYHVIAISGGNIAILAGLMLAGFRLAGMLGRVAMLSAIVVLLAYARLVGGGASVDRATLMAVTCFAARFIDHRSPPINALAFVALCLVATQPLSVADPAFILTFGATLAILWLAPMFSGSVRPRVLVLAGAMLAASVATEVVLLPVGALVFSRVTFAGLVLNFAAIPLMTVVQLAGMALVPIALVSEPVARALGYVAHLAAAGLIRSADLVALVPVLTSRVAPPRGAVVAVYYAALVSAWWYWNWTRWRRASLAVVAAAAFWIVAQPWTLLAARGDGRLHVTFVDVAQGDAAFVRFPRGATLLVDSGGLSPLSTFDVGDRVVAPLLRASGVRRLDVLALSHGDPDHIGGAESIVREFRPRDIWEGIPVPRFEPLQALRRQATAAGARWWNLKRGDRTRIDEVEVMVRHPDAPDWERQRVRNDDSIVIELRWRDVSVLLTGDIGRAVERDLLAAMPPARLRVVKVPHHGSLTSSAPEFVSALSATVAVASAGRANHFGHPVPSVLDRYRQSGAEVFRTDRDGAVTIDTDGESLSVRGFTGRTFSTR
ncbi:MAG: DNA internalization-related competence protein ComEC/Rec2 [Acidobacteriota bacterium]